MPRPIDIPVQRMVLPRLRNELEFMQGPCDRAGSPTCLIYDPLRDAFFQIGEREAALLSCWNVASREADDLVRKVESDTDLLTDREEIAAVSRFLLSNELAELGDTPAALPQTFPRRFFRVTRQLLFHRHHLLDPAPIVALLSGYRDAVSYRLVRRHEHSCGGRGALSRLARPGAFRFILGCYR